MAVRLFVILVFLLLFIALGVLLWGDASTKTYQVQLDSADAVYDGDTLKDVAVKLREFQDAGDVMQTLWPGIVFKDGTLYVITDVRVRNLDTAEKRPTRKGRTPESLALEKKVAEEARQLVVNLLESSDFRFRIKDPALGKYSGRTVCDVFVGDVNLAEALIQNGLGYAYDGGQKLEFDQWYQKE